MQAIASIIILSAITLKYFHINYNLINGLAQPFNVDCNWILVLHILILMMKPQIKMESVTILTYRYVVTPEVGAEVFAAMITATKIINLSSPSCIAAVASSAHQTVAVWTTV